MLERARLSPELLLLLVILPLTEKEELSGHTWTGDIYQRSLPELGQTVDAIGKLTTGFAPSRSCLATPKPIFSVPAGSNGPRCLGHPSLQHAVSH